MALAAVLAGVGLALEVGGNIFSAFGNRDASRQEEADLRADAAAQQAFLEQQQGFLGQQQALLGQQADIYGEQTELGRQRLATSRDTALTDIGLGTANAQSSLLAGSATSGVRGSSGSVGAVSTNINEMSGMARDRTMSEFNLGMHSVDIQEAQNQYSLAQGQLSIDRGQLSIDQAQYDIDGMLRGADNMEENRGWSFWGDMLGAGTTAMKGLQRGAEAGWWG